jgi:predicted RNase H-like HicB family nuclease
MGAMEQTQNHTTSKTYGGRKASWKKPRRGSSREHRQESDERGQRIGSSMLHYQIQWSDEDQAYVVILPEWADRYMMPIASGKTYEEAARRGRNALEYYIAFAQGDGTPLPEPHTFAAASM